jgi:hypothetical protein
MAKRAARLLKIPPSDWNQAVLHDRIVAQPAAMFIPKTVTIGHGADIRDFISSNVCGYRGRTSGNRH